MGFTPRLSDSEVITMEIVGEVLGHDGDKAIWAYFRRHWAAWFPGARGSDYLCAASGQSLADQADIA